MERFAAGRNSFAGGDDCDRSRRRRAGSKRDGHRARRAVRARATASIARPHRPRRRALDLRPALQAAARRYGQSAACYPARNRRRLPYRRGGFKTARRRRPARHPAKRRARFPHRPDRRSRQTPCRCARRCRADTDARSEIANAARTRRCATCSICSAATKRSDYWARANQEIEIPRLGKKVTRSNMELSGEPFASGNIA